MLEFVDARTGIVAALSEANPWLGFRTERSREMFKKILATMLMAGLGFSALPAYAQSEETGPQEPTAHAAKERTAVVFRFAVQSEPVSDVGSLASQACPQDTDGANPISSAPSN